MTTQLVFVHGRSQEKRDAVQLKAEWVDAWARGLAKSGLQIPISERDIRFPYYGQTLFDLVADVPDDQVADVIVRGVQGDDPQQKEFLRSVLEEVCEKAGIDQGRLAEVVDSDVATRGLLNREFVHGILKAIDRCVPHGSGAGIALATNDVYQYLKNPGIRDKIETGVHAALTADHPTVVVAHSLGTVVAYNLLRRDGPAMKWKVPLLVTLGSPLAVTAIKKALRPIRAVSCVGRWYNAMDERDIVALYPLDAANFKIDPAIENKTDVDNHTSNRHGIAGYLGDRAVARQIYDALMA